MNKQKTPMVPVTFLFPLPKIKEILKNLEILALDSEKDLLRHEFTFEHKWFDRGCKTSKLQNNETLASLAVEN